MQSMIKRISAVLLVLTMLFSMTTAAFAEEFDEDSGGQMEMLEEESADPAEEEPQEQAPEEEPAEETDETSLENPEEVPAEEESSEILPEEEPQEEVPEEEPLEESSEESSEEPAEESSEEPAEIDPEAEPEEEIPEETAEETVEEPQEETAEELPEESAEESSEEAPVEVPAEAAEEEAPEEEPEEEDPAKEFLTQPENTSYGGMVEIGEWTTQISTAGMVKYYYFIPDETGTYRFESYGQEDDDTIDPIGEIFNSSWESLARNDDADSGTTRNFEITINLTAGQKYYLCISMYSSRTGVVQARLSKITTGWNKIGDDWYYYQDGSYIIDDALEINGKLYYFDGDGRMMKNTVVVTGGQPYGIGSNGVLYELSDGWHKIAKKYYYVKNKELYCNEVKEIDGKWYGFYWDYSMFDGESFTMSGYAYRAKPGGVLYENEWYQVEDGSWYYYGEAGKGASGLKTIGTREYYFLSSGKMLCNEYVRVSGTVYIADSKGNVTVGSEGWNKAGSTYFYVHGGEVYEDTVVLINEYYYGFDPEGRMYSNTSFEFDGSLFRAKAGGKLYAKEWYVDGRGQKYYFGADARAYSDVRYIEGKAYYFNPYLITNKLVNNDGEWNLAGEDGVLTVLQNGWNQAGISWYYLKDGVLLSDTVETIGGALYGFDSNWRMRTSEYFQWNGKRYYAKSSGKLSAGEWYQNNNNDWLYFAPSGEQIEDQLYEIGGKKYYFTADGIMATSCAIEDSGKYYVAGKSGVVYEVNQAGWIQVDGQYYYKDGAFARSEIRLINGKLYAFNADGLMYDNCRFNHTGKRYRARSGGALYAAQWAQDDQGNWEYYKEDGAGAEGILEIGGKNYCFYKGTMFMDQVGKTDGRVWYAGQNGVLVTLSAGWNKCGKNYYYVEDGDYYKSAVYKIGVGTNSKYYGFDSYGKMYDGALFYYDSGLYLAQKGGVLITNQWRYNTGLGDKRWFDASGKSAEGLFIIDGKKYYQSLWSGVTRSSVIEVDGVAYLADVNGVLTEAKEGWNLANGYYYYIVQGNLLKNTVKRINGTLYYFTSSGVMLDNQQSGSYRAKRGGQLYVNEWYKDSLGRWYYYGEDGKAPRNELREINGKTYYFSSEGYYCTNIPVTINAEPYFTDAAGRVTPARYGWNEFNGSKYYVNQNGGFLTGIHVINGKTYVFSSAYEMICNYEWYANDDTYYILGSDGARIEKGWVKLDGKWYYVDPNTHTTVTGKQKINGKWYYFYKDSGAAAMWTGEILLDGELYIYGDNGVLKSSKALVNGWNLVDGEYYYLKNGKMYTGWVGNYYVSEGKMLRNQSQGQYYLGQDGKYLKAQWVLDDFGARYVQADGKMAKGWLKLDGSWYYFNDSYNVVTGVQVIDGKVYQFDKDGRMLATLSSSVKDGWLKAGSSYTYIQDGRVRTGIISEDGKTMYYLNYDGIMVKNAVIGGYYFGASGKQEKVTGWKKVDGKWYYFDSTGIAKVSKGILEVNGKFYYYPSSSENYFTGWRVIEARLLHFNSSGVLDEIVEPTKSGWIQKDSSWYYYDESLKYFYRGDIKTIGGIDYGFSGDYTLAKNEVIDGYFCDSKGVVAKTAGWKTDANGKKWYTDSNGKVLTGIRIIDGKTYYFD